MSSASNGNVGAGAAAAAATIQQAKQRAKILDREEKRPSILYNKQLTSFSEEQTWFRRFSGELVVAAKLHPPSACSAPNSPRTLFEQHYFEAHPEAKKNGGVPAAVAAAAAAKLGKI